MFEKFKNFKYFIRNELARYIVVSIWFAGNLTAFLIVYFHYQNALEYFYLTKIVQYGVSVSRAAAICININCMLILLPVCRNLISYLRSFLTNVSIKRGLFDKHITYHRHIGYTIMVFSIVHTLGHVHNFERLVSAYDTYKDTNNTQANLLAGLLNTLSLLPVLPNGTYINPIRHSNANTIGETFKLASGVTGIVMCIVLSLFASSASEYIRRSFYNLFYYTHHVLSVLFIASFCVHGIQGVVRRQTNTNRHNPQNCYLKYTTWSSTNKECDIPQFAGSSPTSYIWIAGPLILYLLDRFIRFVRGFRRHRVTKFILHPSSVLELQLDEGSKDKIKYTAGQYVYLNYPAISKLEWHPFTITSAPNDPYMSVHIRSGGDWTSELAKGFKAFTASTNDPKLNIHIDGPYGSCAEDIFSYSKVVLIGAGIGVTPYASILKHISYMIKLKTIKVDLSKVYFFWICPSMDTFEWFGSLLKSLEHDMNSSNCTDMLEYKIYLTKGWTLNEARQIAENEQDYYDLFTGLEQKTHYGRPNFDAFFKDLSANLTPQQPQQASERVGVFFCGPAELSHELHTLCNKYSSTNCRFVYNKENF